MPPWQLKERHGPNRSDHLQEMLIVKIRYQLYRLNPIPEAFLIKTAAVERCSEYLLSLKYPPLGRNSL
jgi:hypothetical protein